MSGAVPPPLLELAALWGVLPEHEERPGGPVHEASAETLLAVLKALGAPLARMDEAADAVRAHRAERAEALAPPVQVVWTQAASSRVGDACVPVGFAGGAGAPRLACTLELEDGAVHEWGARAGGLRLPEAIPHGYHRLTLRAGARETTVHLVCAPPTTWEPEDTGRDFGFFLPLYALRTGEPRAVANLGDLRRLLGWSAERGARFLGTLPLTATFVGHGRAPLDPGPYAPVSRLFWNELYLDFGRAPGWAEAEEARALVAAAAWRAEAARLAEGRRVRWADAARHLRPVLDALARAVSPADDALDGPLGAWAAAHPDAVPYARFRARTEREGPWRGWRREAPDADEAAFRSHLYAQWAMERQMAELAADAPAQLYLDLPLGTHPDGFDVWRWPDAFVQGLSVGAPPDPFQEAGQDWGFPPLHPGRTRHDGHAYARRSLRHLMTSSGMIRLDHVMGLHRLWCVPEGAGATEGAYVRYPAEELYAILCLESHRCRTEVVGEDLGTVPEEVHDAMSRHRLRRMWVLPFELDPETGRLDEPDPLSVASVGTHDLPPFAAQDTDAELGLEEALTTLAASPARHLLVDLADLWGETESQNAPGTVSDENWTLRAPHPLEAWDDLPGLQQTLERIQRTRKEGSWG